MAQLHNVRLDEALERLARLSRLEPDWDSYGALPMARLAPDVARTFVLTSIDRFADGAPDRAVPYTAMPIADGGVSLEWRGPTSSLELDISPEGTLGYLLIERVGDGRRFEEASAVSVEQAYALIGRVIGA